MHPTGFGKYNSEIITIIQKRQARREAMKKEIEEKQAEIERAKVAAETMFSGLGSSATDGTEPQRRRQEIHWDYDKKGLY